MAMACVDCSAQLVQVSSGKCTHGAWGLDLPIWPMRLHARYRTLHLITRVVKHKSQDTTY